MKIIRWFFSHIILVLLIVVVIYGYVFWGRLVDSDTPGGKAIAYLSNKFAPTNESVENSMDASSKSFVVNNELPSGDKSIFGQQSNVSVSDASSTIEDATVSASAVNTNKKLFVTSDVVEQLDSFDEAGVVVDANDTSSLTTRQSKAAVNETELTIGDANTRTSAFDTAKDVFISPDVEAKLNNTNDNVNDIGETVAASQLNTKVESTDVKANWIAARTSYHQRNYELSEKSYQQVIDNTEENYDAYGELGNVYFNQGKNAQAASAYYEAAAIFVRMGQLSRAESLIGLLWRLDPSKADELQKLIDSASS